MSIRKLAVAALATVALVAVGCGKSSSTGTASQSTAQTASQAAGSTQTNSKGAPESLAEMRAGAERLCLRLRERRASNRAETLQQVAQAAGELAAFEQMIVSEMERLNPPAPLSTDWKQIVAGARTLASDTVKIGEAAKSGTINSATAVIASRHGTELQILAIAKHDKFKNCSNAL